MRICKLNYPSTNNEKHLNNYYTSYSNNTFAISFIDAAMCDVWRTQGICSIWSALGVYSGIGGCIPKEAEINSKRPIRGFIVLDACL